MKGIKETKNEKEKIKGIEQEKDNNIIKDTKEKIKNDKMNENKEIDQANKDNKEKDKEELMNKNKIINKEKNFEKDKNKIKNNKTEKKEKINEINIIKENKIIEIKKDENENKNEIIKEEPENKIININTSKNDNNTNQEILDIFTEIQQINNREKNTKKISLSQSSDDEENIININNDNKNIIINSSNNYKNPKKIEIIDNYFDFHMHDIDLVQIESYYKTYKNITQEDSKLIKLILTKYQKFISENLSQTTYPYLINSIKPHFEILETELKQKFFLIQILSRKNTLKKKLFDYFKNLTRINLYGISDKLINIFNKQVVENKNFDIFSEKLSKWHCHVEMIVLYLDILSKLFNDHFDFNKQKFSLESNFKSNTDILIKKNFYKLASKICSKISLNPGIDYQKLITFALTIITTGAGGAAGAVVPMTVQFSQQQLARIIGIFGLNFLTQKASTEFGSASEMQEFNALSSLVEKLNASLLKIEKTCYRLIILELQEEIYSNLESSRVDLDISKKKEEISKLLENFLKGVECPEDIEKKIQEEYITLNASIVEEKYDNDWIIQHLSVNEVENNNDNENNNKNIIIKENNNSNVIIEKNDNKNKDNNKEKEDKKEKNIFDDFVDINKGDFDDFN